MALTGGAILVPGNELKIWHSFARVEAKKKWTVALRGCRPQTVHHPPHALSEN